MARQPDLPLFGTPVRLPRGVKTAVEWVRGRRRALRQRDYELEFAHQLAHSEPRVATPVRQFKFAKTLGRQFAADFAWPPQRLLVEVQGGIWRRGGGAHSHPINLERDVDKAQAAALLGYTLLPVTPGDVESGRALELVRLLLRAPRS